MSSSTATPADAELVLKLYDLRRESKMREARDWLAGAEFKTYEDFVRMVFQFGSKENAYFRQVTTYWETAASLVANGALNGKLFFDTQGEMWFVYTKLKPFLAQMRQQMKAPQMLKNMEAVAVGTHEGQQRVSDMEERIKMFAQMRAQQAAAK